MLVYTYTDSEIQTLANQAKEVMLLSLEAEGLLTKPAEELMETYVIVVHKRGWLGQQIDKLLGTTEVTRLLVTKLIGLPSHPKTKHDS